MYENIAKGSYDEVLIDQDFYVLKIQNDTDVVKQIEREIDSSFIQFHFSLKGQAKFLFNEGNYGLEVSEEKKAPLLELLQKLMHREY